MYFKALGVYGVPPEKVYIILKDKLNLSVEDLGRIERCYRIDTTDKTRYAYSLSELEDTIYSEDFYDTNLRITSENIWYQMVQNMKKNLKGETDE